MLPPEQIPGNALPAGFLKNTTEPTEKDTAMAFISDFESLYFGGPCDEDG